MSGPLDGVRVLEVASHVFVPIAGGVLTEWGASVVKVEHPVTGDPYRGLVTAGLHKSYNGIDPSFQFTNRGKRSVTIDLKTEDGRDLVYRLARESDVFLTNFRPAALRRLQLDCDHVRSSNPNIIYVHGTGYGARGPDVDRGGYDSAAYWSRVGFGEVFTPPDAEFPVMQRPAFGDVVGGLTIAGAIAAALYRRTTTGEPSVVDVSLLGVGMWQLQPDITHAKLNAGNPPPAPRDRKATWNPLSGTYRTRDGRFINLVMLDADRYWADLCVMIGHPEMAGDPRFVDMAARKANARACVEWLDAVFAERDYADWCARLSGAKGVWSPFQTPAELHADPQVAANGYLADVDMINGEALTLVTSPAQFDGRPPSPVRAPEHGEHTEEVLLEMGLDWDELVALKDKQVIG
jgi:crotonobetainyl-CoA:carnitine CoA-transferase CaiB-like acyl-CoA transferase